MKLIQLCILFSSAIFSLQSMIQYNTEIQINNTLTKLKNIFNINYPNDGQGYILFVVQYDPNNLSDKLIKYIGLKNVNIIVLNVVNECDIYFLIRQEQKNNFGRAHLIYYFTEASQEKLNATFKCYESTNLWKPRTKTVVLFSELVNKTDLTFIFKNVCWKRKILNLITVFPSGEQILTVTYNPYFENWYQEISVQNIFYDKLKNLNGYEINISLIKADDNTKVKLEYNATTNFTEYTAKDGLTIRNILRIHNATYKVFDFQGMLEAGNPFRSNNRNAKVNEKLEIIQKYDIDLFFLSQEMMSNNNVSEMIYPHAKDDWIILVPHSGYMSQYDFLYATFKNGLGIIFGFFLIICPIIWFLLHYISMKINHKHIRKVDSFTLIVIDNFRMMLGFGIDRIFTNFTSNMFLLFIVYCNLIINNYVQSILYSVLTVANRLPEINTIMDFINSDYIVEAVQNLYDEILLNFGQTSHKGLINKFRIFDFAILSKNLSYFRFKRNESVFFNQDRGNYICARRPLFRVVKESILPAHISFHTAKHSPYYELLEKLIPRFMESGLYTYWMKSSLYLQILQEGLIIDDEDEVKAYNDLTLHQFRAPIYMFLVGLACSGFVFICELILGWCRKCTKSIQ